VNGKLGFAGKERQVDRCEMLILKTHRKLGIGSQER